MPHRESASLMATSTEIAIVPTSGGDHLGKRLPFHAYSYLELVEEMNRVIYKISPFSIVVGVVSSISRAPHMGHKHLKVIHGEEVFHLTKETIHISIVRVFFMLHH